MNKRGQALIEFILILPVIIILLLVFIDMANLFYQKTKILNDFSTYTKLPDEQSKNQFLVENELMMNKTADEIVLSKEIKLITPGLKKLFEEPYIIEASGFIYE